MSSRFRTARLPGDRRFRLTPKLEWLEDRTVPAWTTLASMPTARTEIAAALAPNGLIFALGGTDSSQQPLNTAQVYNPSTGAWFTTFTMPEPSMALAAATGSDGRVYAIGGNDSSGPDNFAQAFSLVTNRWQRVANLPTPRSDLAAVAGPNGLIYAIGGVANFGTT